MKSFLLKLFTLYKTSKIKKQISFGNNCRFSLKSSVVLLFGSTKANVCLGDNVRMFGSLVSSHGGAIKMLDNSQIGYGSVIRSINEVIIEEFATISENVVISDNNNHPVNPLDRLIVWKTPVGSEERSWKYSDSASIRIGRNCWIGENSRICKGVTIGNGSIVAANSVVTKDVPANCIVAGNPARVVRTDIDKVEKIF